MNQLEEKLSAILQDSVDRQEVAGLNVLVKQDNKEIAYAQAGYADREKKAPYERDTIVRLYSMSKPITAAAVMLLVERGKLDLGAYVQEIIPAYSETPVEENGRTVPAVKAMRVFDLMNMTSGLSYGGNPDSLSSVETEKLFVEIIEKLGTKEALATVEIAERLGRCPLAFQPGSSWQYGTSADVLGAVVELVSGRRFGDFLREEFFEPLGMEDTGFYVPQEKQRRLATVYEWSPEGLTPYFGSHLGIMNSMSVAPAFESGGAGLASTIDDYAKFAQMLMQEGSFNGRQILKPKTVSFLTSGQLKPWQQEVLGRTWDGLDGYSYGNLMRVMKQKELACGMTSDGEYGWDGWLGTFFANSPADKITFLVTLQRNQGSYIQTSPVRKLRNVVWSELGM